eukprot:2036171-Prymnesium_polylepis.1
MSCETFWRALPLRLGCVLKERAQTAVGAALRYVFSGARWFVIAAPALEPRPQNGNARGAEGGSRIPEHRWISPKQHKYDTQGRIASGSGYRLMAHHAAKAVIIQPDSAARSCAAPRGPRRGPNLVSALLTLRASAIAFSPEGPMLLLVLPSRNS